MAHFYEIIFLHHYMDVFTPIQRPRFLCPHARYQNILLKKELPGGGGGLKKVTPTKNRFRGKKQTMALGMGLESPPVKNRLG